MSPPFVEQLALSASGRCQRLPTNSRIFIGWASRAATTARCVVAFFRERIERTVLPYYKISVESAQRMVALRRLEVVNLDKPFALALHRTDKFVERESIIIVRQ